MRITSALVLLANLAPEQPLLSLAMIFDVRLFILRRRMLLPGPRLFLCLLRDLLPSLLLVPRRQSLSCAAYVVS